MLADPITAIEAAIVTRLQAGLGKMVTEVASYAGELDDDLPNVVRRFPAAWVTFGGISKTEPYGTSKEKHKATGQFVVMVGTRNLRGGSAARQGQDGIGSNQLVMAVRRLLTQQDLGLEIAHLKPGKVRTLYNTRIEGVALQVFACEFDTTWIETALPNNTWPAPDNTGHPDIAFAAYQGRLDAPATDWLTVGLNFHLTPDDGKADSSDQLTLRSQP